MPTSNQLTNAKNVVLAAALAVLTSVMLVVGLIANTVSAAGTVSFGTNIEAVVNDGVGLVLTVQVQDAPDVYELEVDHNLTPDFPEFSVYADEADPYGGHEPSFSALGVTVTYSSATATWTIDFGNTVTDDMKDMNGGVAVFYFALRDANRNLLYGDMMDGSNLSNYRLVLDFEEGEATYPPATEVAVLSDEDDADDDADAVIPGVPNTSLAL